MTWLRHMGSLPIWSRAVPRAPARPRAHRPSRLWLVLRASILAAAAISPGVTRAAAPTAGGISTSSVPNPSASQAKARFDAENGAAMARMMAGMDVNPTGDVGHDFVAMMVPHHRGAIDMAETELRYGRNEQLLRIAQQIVVEQLQEIAAMRVAVGERVSSDEALIAAAARAASAAPPPAGVKKSAHSLQAEAPFVADNNAAMEMMMRGMTITPSGDVDHDFVAMMVPHHQGAIDMAEAELRYGGNANARLRLIAQEIIVDQTQEIILMRLSMGQALPPSVSAPTDRSPAPTTE